MTAGQALGCLQGQAWETRNWVAIQVSSWTWMPGYQKKNVASLTCLHPTSSKAAPQRVGTIENVGIKLDHASH